MQLDRWLNVRVGENEQCAYLINKELNHYSEIVVVVVKCIYVSFLLRTQRIVFFIGCARNLEDLLFVTGENNIVQFE